MTFLPFDNPRPFKQWQDQNTDLACHIYLREATSYLRHHYQQLLPHWQEPPQRLIIFLFQALLDLAPDSLEVTSEKNRLRELFFQFGSQLQSDLASPLDIICPQTGRSIHNPQQGKPIDIVAVVHSALSVRFYPTSQHCKVLSYRDWKTSVYPSLIVTSAEPITINLALNQVLLNSGKRRLSKG